MDIRRRRPDPDDDHEVLDLPHGGTEYVFRGLGDSLSTSLRSLGYRSEEPNPATSVAPEAPTRPERRSQAYSGPHANRSFWHDCQRDVMWDGRPVELVDCNLTEWAPLHPGLFYAPRSSDVRRRATATLTESTVRLGHHYVPRGKQANHALRRRGLFPAWIGEAG
jgi:hypothetical protein